LESDHQISLDVAVFEDKYGNDTIKWETYPLLDKTVKIYSFLNPSFPEFRTFEREVKISEGGAIIPFSGKKRERKYYYLLFNNKYPVITSTRTIKTDSILILRELGGYENQDKCFTKWGKVFCSGRVNLKDSGKDLFNSLRINTIIDLRSEKERAKMRYTNINAKVISIPIPNFDVSDIQPKLEAGQFTREDAFSYMKNTFSDMVMDYQKEFEKVFDVLLQEGNYPILINCNSGNDRSSFISALILSALDVSRDQIISNYTSTNSFSHIREEGKYAYKLSPEAQEAVTVLLSCNPDFLLSAFNEIEKQYGSINNYLETAINIDYSKRKKLQELLLYKY